MHEGPNKEEIKRGEIERTNYLFKKYQGMVLSGKWDSELHNETMIALQIAWPYAYALLPQASAERDE